MQKTKNSSKAYTETQRQKNTRDQGTATKPYKITMRVHASKDGATKIIYSSNRKKLI